MNFKQLTLLVVLFITSLSLFLSCDKIDEPYFKPVYTERYVLSELVTDAQTLDQSLYTQFTNLNSSSTLITPMIILSNDNGAGQFLAETFSVDNGDAMINRIAENSKYGIKQNNWSSKLEIELAKKGEFNLEMEGQIDFADTTFKSNYKVSSLNGYDQNLNLSVYLLEDSVEINGITVSNLLRKSNENIHSFANLQRGETFESSLQVNLSGYNISQIYNFKVVLILKNASTNEILQTSIQEIGAINFSKKQKILVEDFTGHKCGNCPNAHVELARLINTYGSQVIPMAIHFGFYARTTTSYPTDFTTEVGDAIGNKFGISGTPIGMVNRSGYLDKKIDYSAWDAKISSIINNTPKVGIALQTELQGNMLTSKIFVKAFEQNDTLLNIQAFIIEDHIVDKQLWYGHNPEEIEDYEHEHVLRTSLNGNWGEELTPAPFKQNKIIEKHISYTLNSAWNTEHLSLIVIVYNSETDEILQVEEMHI